LHRRTKIVCTIGPASWSEENLGKLMDAGMNVARFNFSHGDHEGHGAVLERLRKVASEKSRNIAGKKSFPSVSASVVQIAATVSNNFTLHYFFSTILPPRLL
jgi:hypothetical protein